MGWRCFLIERTRFCRRSLRRFRRFTDVPSGHYCDVSVVIEAKFECPGDKNGRSTDIPGPWDNNPGWPLKCSCGYAFQPGDHRQVNEERLWKGAPERKIYPLRENPPGAMWVSDWFPQEGPNGEWTGPDGKVWCVMLPGGVEWIVYSYSSDTPRRKWSVQGEPPNITVSPSINQKGLYHGHIKNGVITDDVDGRKFPKWRSTA